MFQIDMIFIHCDKISIHIATKLMEFYIFTNGFLINNITHRIHLNSIPPLSPSRFLNISQRTSTLSTKEICLETGVD